MTRFQATATRCWLLSNRDSLLGNRDSSLGNRCLPIKISHDCFSGSDISISKYSKKKSSVHINIVYIYSGIGTQVCKLAIYINEFCVPDGMVFGRTGWGRRVSHWNEAITANLQIAIVNLRQTYAGQNFTLSVFLFPFLSPSRSLLLTFPIASASTIV